MCHHLLGFHELLSPLWVVPSDVHQRVGHAAPELRLHIVWDLPSGTSLVQQFNENVDLSS